jgi:septum formation protein
MQPPILILASASPRRQELLRSAGISFEVIPSEVDEEMEEGEAPDEHVIRLARLKAVKVGKKHKTRWVLAADTVVVVDGRILGKPRDRREAEEMLEMLSAREHRVVTGYCLLQMSSGKSRQGRVVSRVRFKDLSLDEIRWYLDSGEPFGKAGAYAIQGKAAFMWWASPFVRSSKRCGKCGALQSAPNHGPQISNNFSKFGNFRSAGFGHWHRGG